MNEILKREMDRNKRMVEFLGKPKVK